MAVFPAGLPEPVWTDVEHSGPVGVLQSTQMDSGPAKRRPRSTAGIVPFSLTFAPVTEVAYEEFIQFFFDDLKMGALAFDMPHPITGVVLSWLFADEDPYSVTGLGDGVVSIAVNLVLLP